MDLEKLMVYTGEVLFSHAVERYQDPHPHGSTWILRLHKTERMESVMDIFGEKVLRSYHIHHIHHSKIDQNWLSNGCLFVRWDDDQ